MEDTKENQEEKRDYINENAMKVINALLDPDKNILMSVSNITKREAFLLSIQVAKEATLELGSNPRGILTTTIWRQAYLRLMRSVGGKTLGYGFGYAGMQQEVETEAAANKEEW